MYPKQSCQNPACSFFRIEVTTDNIFCLFCHKPFSSLQSLFSTLFGEKI